MEESIRIQNAEFQYATQEEAGDVAVDDVSFSVRKGEFLAIIGHNGCGKSTLAKLLNGLFIPTSGSVLVDGIPTSDEERVWEVRRRIGMVFQNPDNQIIASLVEEDVAFGLENLGVQPAEIRKRVDEALRQVNMSDFKDRAPHNLSGGQKQRVAIAGVLAMRPEVMVFDEPTAMLDPAGRREVMETVWRLNREQGITVVWITHFMEEAMQADRLLVMEKGKIVSEGAPEVLFQDVEGMKTLGLDVPPMAELGYLLRQRGIELRKSVMSVEEMVEEICRYKQKT